VSRPFRLLLLLLALPSVLLAQDLARQPTAFTAYLDFHTQATELPIWIERVETQSIKPDLAQPAGKTIFRIRFRHFAGLVDEVLLRVYFQDNADTQPVLSGWSEIGARVLPPQTLGQGLGMPSSETVRFPMAGLDYIDIETPGDGSSLRGALAVAIHKTETREALDFGGTADVTDPFGAAAPTIAGTNDILLFGRVKATLEPGVIPLAAGAGTDDSAGFEFPLDHPPMIALLTFEILNADIASPPQLSVNGKVIGDVNMAVTDLADPALTGAVEAARADPVYHYSGWLKCQKVIPGSLLLAGTNDLFITLPGRPSPVALRSVEIQLKYTPDATSP
jgi:hypothetical protein